MRFSRLAIVVLLLVGAMLLAACGGDDEDDAERADPDMVTGEAVTEGPEHNLVGTISGAVEKDFAFDAIFSCQDSGMEGVADIFEMVATPGIEQFYVSLPFNTPAGTFDLVGSDELVMNTPAEEQYQIRYRTEDRVSYDMGTGEIIISNVPAEPGEPFAGTLTALLTDEDGNSINLDATFTVDAASFAFDGCE